MNIKYSPFSIYAYIVIVFAVVYSSFHSYSLVERMVVKAQSSNAMTSLGYEEIPSKDKYIKIYTRWVARKTQAAQKIIQPLQDQTKPLNQTEKEALALAQKQLDKVQSFSQYFQYLQKNGSALIEKDFQEYNRNIDAVDKINQQRQIYSDLIAILLSFVLIGLHFLLRHHTQKSGMDKSSLFQGLFQFFESGILSILAFFFMCRLASNLFFQAVGLIWAMPVPAGMIMPYSYNIWRSSSGVYMHQYACNLEWLVSWIDKPDYTAWTGRAMRHHAPTGATSKQVISAVKNKQDANLQPTQQIAFGFQEKKVMNRIWQDITQERLKEAQRRTQESIMDKTREARANLWYILVFGVYWLASLGFLWYRRQRISESVK
jgi:hypothetical protein